MGVGKTVYKGEVKTGVFAWFSDHAGPYPVGASLLAMEVNDNEGCLSANGALTFIASKLAPTGHYAEINSNR